MVARYSVALTIAALVVCNVPAFAAPEGPSETAAPAAAASQEAAAPVAAAPAASPAPVQAAPVAEAARPAPRATRTARSRAAAQPARVAQPRIYQVASSAPVSCRSFQCLTGGVILLGVGF